MLSKFFITTCLSFIALLPGTAQEWLGKSKTEIRTGITGKGVDAEVLSETDSTLALSCEEEDERCRKFDVYYEFSFKDETCTSYQRILPLHSYWAITLQDQITLDEGEGSGEELDIDGESLQTDYLFEDYTLHLSIQDGKLIASFQLKK